MRTWPASTSIAALVRALTTRACHSHLSRRWRSKHHQILDPEKSGRTTISALILAVGGELLLERRQLGKGRIRIDRPVAFARRRGAGGILPVRRAAIGASLTAAFRPTKLALVPALVAAIIFAILAPVLAATLEALTRRTALVIARLAG